MIHLERHDRVALLTIDRQQRRNAIDHEAVGELHRLLLDVRDVYRGEPELALGNVVGNAIWLRLGIQTDFSLTNSRTSVRCTAPRGAAATTSSSGGSAETGAALPSHRKSASAVMTALKRVFFFFSASRSKYSASFFIDLRASRWPAAAAPLSTSRTANAT